MGKLSSPRCSKLFLYNGLHKMCEISLIDVIYHFYIWSAIVFDGVGRSFIVKVRFNGIIVKVRFNGIIIGIGVPFFDLTISFAGVGMNFNEGGRSKVKGDARLAVKIQIGGAGRRIYEVMLGRVIELVGGRGVGLRRANSGIIIAVASIDGGTSVGTVNAHRNCSLMTAVI